MTNKTNDMDTLIKLHNKGLIDDSAFTKAVKKLNEKAWPMTLPLDVRDSDVPFIPSPLIDKPFIQSTIGKWTSKGNPLTATFTPTQHDDRIQGLYVPDPFSGSILKPVFSHECVWCGDEVNSNVVS